MSEPNTSASGGCLRTTPAFGLDQNDDEISGFDVGMLDGTVVVTDDSLDDFIQGWLACVTGIDGTLFRPRWQPEPPNLPSDENGDAVDWVAFGLTISKRDTFAVVVHDGDGAEGEGVDRLERTEEFDVLLSFYGPHARGRAARLADALQIGQNLEALQHQNMGLIETGVITSVPSLVKQRHLFRADMTLRVRRQVRRTYQVRHLASAEVGLLVQNGQTRNIPITVDEA